MEQNCTPEAVVELIYFHTIKIIFSQSIKIKYYSTSYVFVGYTLIKFIILHYFNKIIFD